MRASALISSLRHGSGAGAWIIFAARICSVTLGSALNGLPVLTLEENLLDAVDADADRLLPTIPPG